MRFSYKKFALGFAVVCVMVVGSIGATPKLAEAATMGELFSRLSIKLEELRTVIMSTVWWSVEPAPELAAITLTSRVGSTQTYDENSQLAISYLADVDVLKMSDNEFYITGTAVQDTRKIKIYRTTDLKTFTLVSIVQPDLLSTSTDYCHVWAPDLSYWPATKEFALTFSAQIRAEKQPCLDPILNTPESQPTMYITKATDITKFSTPTTLQYGEVKSQYGLMPTALKIDPDRFENRLYYVWFNGGNNIASVSTISSSSPLLHVNGKLWNEGNITEAPQLFRGPNQKIYLQFSTHDLKTGYTTKYMTGNTPADLVRTASNVKTIANPAVAPGCDLTTSACVLENYGHGAIFSKGNQYYYFHHRMWPNTGVFTNRAAYLTPIYFKSNGDIVSMTNTQLSWNQLGGDYQYSLDVVKKDKTVVGPCQGSGILKNSNSFNFSGTCMVSGVPTITRKQDIATFRLCYSRDKQWGVGHSVCKDVVNDIKQDTLAIALDPLPHPINKNISWNQLGSDYEYSLDVVKKDGTTVGPCIPSTILKNAISFLYQGVCNNVSATAIPKQDIAAFRLCYSRDKQWGEGHSSCASVSNDLTKDTVSLVLTKLPPPVAKEVTLSWNAPGSDYEYAINVLQKDGTATAPCIPPATTKNLTSLVFNGQCTNVAGTHIERTAITFFNLCYTRAGQWGTKASKCVKVANGLTKNSFTFTLTPLPDPTKVTVFWNQLGGEYTYSLDVLSNDGQWTAPCVNSNTLQNTTSYSYTGNCENVAKTAVPRVNVNRFRLCYSKDGQWGVGHSQCTPVTNDLTKDTLLLTLQPIP